MGHFKFSINLEEGSVHLASRGREIPKAFYRSEKFRGDEVDKLLSLSLAKHLAQRSDEHLSMSHTSRWEVPKQMKLSKKISNQTQA
jgi:hypothetical protein